MPSGRHLGAVLDVWFNQVINQQISGGGIAFFDPLRLSSHGRSWRQTRFHLDGIEITDPARPGEPLFDLPYAAWNGLEYRSLWTARPGVDLGFRAETPTTWVLAGATGRNVGGGTWIPSGLLDREPATEYGATPERRRLRPVAELSVERAWQLGPTGGLRLLGAFVEHEHRYPTLRSSDGRNVVDHARRATFALRHHIDNGRTQIGTTVFGQTGERSHEGAQYRWEQPLTLDTSSRVWGAHFRWVRPTAKLSVFTGVTGRGDDERPDHETPVVRDLESEWLYLARPRAAEDLGRWRFDAGADWDWKGWGLRMRGAHSRIDLEVHTQSVHGISYLRGPARGQPAAHSLGLVAPGLHHALWGRGCGARSSTRRCHGAGGDRAGPRGGRGATWTPARVLVSRRRGGAESGMRPCPVLRAGPARADVPDAGRERVPESGGRVDDARLG